MKTNDSLPGHINNFESFSKKDIPKKLQERIIDVYNTDDVYSTIKPKFPKSALVELSNACNHKCIFCTNPRMNRPTQILDFKKYQRFIDQATKLGLTE